MLLAALLLFVIGFWSYVIEGKKWRVVRVIVVLTFVLLLASHMWIWALNSTH